MINVELQKNVKLLQKPNITMAKIYNKFFNFIPNLINPKKLFLILLLNLVFKFGSTESVTSSNNEEKYKLLNTKEESRSIIHSRQFLEELLEEIPEQGSSREVLKIAESNWETPSSEEEEEEEEKLHMSKDTFDYEETFPREFRHRGRGENNPRQGNDRPRKNIRDHDYSSFDDEEEEHEVSRAPNLSFNSKSRKETDINRDSVARETERNGFGSQKTQNNFGTEPYFLNDPENFDRRDNFGRDEERRKFSKGFENSKSFRSDKMINRNNENERIPRKFSIITNPDSFTSVLNERKSGTVEFNNNHDMKVIKVLPNASRTPKSQLDSQYKKTFIHDELKNDYRNPEEKVSFKMKTFPENGKSRLLLDDPIFVSKTTLPPLFNVFDDALKSDTNSKNRSSRKSVEGILELLNVRSKHPINHEPVNTKPRFQHTNEFPQLNPKEFSRGNGETKFRNGRNHESQEYRNTKNNRFDDAPEYRNVQNIPNQEREENVRRGRNREINYFEDDSYHDLSFNTKKNRGEEPREFRDNRNHNSQKEEWSSHNEHASRDRSRKRKKNSRREENNNSRENRDRTRNKSSSFDFFDYDSGLGDVQFKNKDYEFNGNRNSERKKSKKLNSPEFEKIRDYDSTGFRGDRDYSLTGSRGNKDYDSNGFIKGKNYDSTQFTKEKDYDNGEFREGVDYDLTGVRKNKNYDSSRGRDDKNYDSSRGRGDKTYDSSRGRDNKNYDSSRGRSEKNYDSSRGRGEKNYDSPGFRRDKNSEIREFNRNEDYDSSGFPNRKNKDSRNFRRNKGGRKKPPKGKNNNRNQELPPINFVSLLENLEEEERRGKFPNKGNFPKNQRPKPQNVNDLLDFIDGPNSNNFDNPSDIEMKEFQEIVKNLNEDPNFLSNLGFTFVNSSELPLLFDPASNNKKNNKGNFRGNKNKDSLSLFETLVSMQGPQTKNKNSGKNNDRNKDTNKNKQSLSDLLNSFNLNTNPRSNRPSSPTQKIKLSPNLEENKGRNKNKGGKGTPTFSTARPQSFKRVTDGKNDKEGMKPYSLRPTQIPNNFGTTTPGNSFTGFGSTEVTSNFGNKNEDIKEDTNKKQPGANASPYKIPPGGAPVFINSTVFVSTTPMPQLYGALDFIPRLRTPSSLPPKVYKNLDPNAPGYPFPHISIGENSALRQLPGTLGSFVSGLDPVSNRGLFGVNNPLVNTNFPTPHPPGESISTIYPTNRGIVSSTKSSVPTTPFPTTLSHTTPFPVNHHTTASFPTTPSFPFPTTPSPTPFSVTPHPTIPFATTPHPTPLRSPRPTSRFPGTPRPTTPFSVTPRPTTPFPASPIPTSPHSIIPQSRTPSVSEHPSFQSTPGSILHPGITANPIRSTLSPFSVTPHPGTQFPASPYPTTFLPGTITPTAGSSPFLTSPNPVTPFSGNNLNFPPHSIGPGLSRPNILPVVTSEAPAKKISENEKNLRKLKTSRGRRLRARLKNGKTAVISSPVRSTVSTTTTTATTTTIATTTTNPVTLRTVPPKFAVRRRLRKKVRRKKKRQFPHGDPNIPLSHPALSLPHLKNEPLSTHLESGAQQNPRTHLRNGLFSNIPRTESVVGENYNHLIHPTLNGSHFANFGITHPAHLNFPIQFNTPTPFVAAHQPDLRFPNLFIRTTPTPIIRTIEPVSLEKTQFGRSKPVINKVTELPRVKRPTGPPTHLSNGNIDSFPVVTPNSHLNSQFNVQNFPSSTPSSFGLNDLSNTVIPISDRFRSTVSPFLTNIGQGRPLFNTVTPLSRGIGSNARLTNGKGDLQNRLVNQQHIPRQHFPGILRQNSPRIPLTAIPFHSTGSPSPTTPFSQPILVTTPGHDSVTNGQRFGSLSPTPLSVALSPTPDINKGSPTPTSVEENVYSKEIDISSLSKHPNSLTGFNSAGIPVLPNGFGINFAHPHLNGIQRIPFPRIPQGLGPYLNPYNNPFLISPQNNTLSSSLIHPSLGLSPSIHGLHSPGTLVHGSPRAIQPHLAVGSQPLIYPTSLHHVPNVRHPFPAQALIGNSPGLRKYYVKKPIIGE